MSYTLGPATSDTPDGLHEAVRDVIAAYRALPTARQHDTSEAGVAVDDHLDAILDAIPMLASAFGEGDPAYVYVVNVSGHANPDHAPRNGWADDFITINVSAVGPPKDEA